ncbi:MAG: hypothetical protein GY828_07860 [Candidatus Gracilibacteria bacterium]|nr:hypothetical protein [Candidatus Gracilibacteria bacterium]
MDKITTIGGGNGQSNLLDALYKHTDSIEISSIVSMSDDGRTTGELMQAFSEHLGIYLPPPGDLRRCLFALSGSEYRDYFSLVFEHCFLYEGNMDNFSIQQLFTQVNKEILLIGKAGKFQSDISDFVEKNDGQLHVHLEHKNSEILNFRLPLHIPLKGHKFGNILMANLYYNFEKDYKKMLDFMHKLLEVKGNIIPVTTTQAKIKAILGNGDIIESQDRISNVADYTSGIAGLELCECSKFAAQHLGVHDAIIGAKYIVVGPGDLFTSIISNFIIGGVKDSLLQSNAKIIYIGNSTNKGGETTGLTQLDFINKVERYLGKTIDYFILNNKKPILSDQEEKLFKKDISIKGGDFLFLSEGEKRELERKKIQIIEADLLDNHSLYKHNKQKIANIIMYIIQSEK